MGEKRPMFRSAQGGRELNIPALYGSAFDDLQRTGHYGELLYRPMDELQMYPNTPQTAATEAEIALLAKMGLEI